MMHYYNILSKRGILFLGIAVILLLLSVFSISRLSMRYLVEIAGLMFWLHGVREIKHGANLSFSKKAALNFGAAISFPLLAMCAGCFAPPIEDVFNARFMWGDVTALNILLIEMTLLWVGLRFYTLHLPVTTFNKVDKKYIGTGSYLIMFMAGTVLLQLVLGLQFHTAFLYDLTDINSFNIGQLLLFTAVLLALATIFLTGYKLTKMLLEGLPEFKERLKYIGIATLIWLPFGYLLLPLQVLGLFILAVLTFALLLDLYCERPGNGYVWFIIWLIFLSSISAASFLQTLNHRAELLHGKELIHTSPEWHDFAHLAYYEKGKKPVKKGIFSDLSAKELARIKKFDKIGKYTVRKHKGNKSVLLLAYPSPSISNGIALFSLFFIFSLIFLVFVAVINSIVRFLPERLKLYLRLRSSLQERIQVIIISTIIVSFIIIGYASVYFFKRRTANIINAETVRDIHYVSKLIQHSNVKVSDPKWQRQHLSPLGYALNAMNREETGEKFKAALEQLNNTNREIYLLRDSSTLQITGAIVPSIKSANHFYNVIKTKTEHRTTSQGILTNLINVYVFLFLIAYAIIIAMAGSITWPLKVLGDRLKQIRLNRENKKLDWPINDEIGQLIKSYNLMLAKLHESVEVLAKTERDNAWREMAKQVAHEIKTPLTPMKLSIQYLKLNAESNPENLKDMIDRVAGTLIEQIDNLSNIATEFSNFAKMPLAKNQKIILNDVVVSVHNLFRKRDDMNIQCYLPIDDIYVFADREQLLRILNNLIKNAIQAIPVERKGIITIRLLKKDNHALISIEDNGVGIPDNMKTKIFEPNFTTKSSGAGLGLAMCRNMIEGFNGKIYFESKPDQGTVFYVEIPMMRLEDNFKEDNRVILT